MRLHAWSSAAHDIEFDPEAGSATIIKLPIARPDTSVPAGFAGFERGLIGARQVFALFRSGNLLFFSAGARRWQLGQPELWFTHRRTLPFLSRFCVLEGGRETYSITYQHTGRMLLAILDPTHDGLDEEQDYFLGFVAQYAQSPIWQAQVRERWAPGL